MLETTTLGVEPCRVRSYCDILNCKRLLMFHSGKSRSIAPQYLSFKCMLSFEWKCLQFKLHLCPIHRGAGVEQQSSAAIVNNCFVCHRPNTKYSCVACAGAICDVCSVPANEDDLGYSDENYRVGKR